MSIVRPLYGQYRAICMSNIVSVYFFSLPSLISLMCYLFLQIFALIPAEVLRRVCISTYMSHGFENCPCGPLFLLSINEIVDCIRGVHKFKVQGCLGGYIL
jgi:hypothetical protein